MTKVRKINIIGHILVLQRSFRNFLNKKNLTKKINCGSLTITKYRINLLTYNKYIQTIEERKIIIKIPKKLYKEK